MELSPKEALKGLLTKSSAGEGWSHSQLSAETLTPISTLASTHERGLRHIMQVAASLRASFFFNYKNERK